MQELFLNSEASVQSDRILYTPSLFARSALLNLQEVGSLKARSPHTSTRSGLTSYLYFLVLADIDVLHTLNFLLLPKQGNINMMSAPIW